MKCRLYAIVLRASVIAMFALGALHERSVPAGPPQAPAPQPRPKYIFLFIGDGMGRVQREAADPVARKLTGKPLLMETLPSVGWIHTRSANAVVTDSAAAATAFGCGIKTNNGMLGITPDKAKVESLCVKLRPGGIKIGLITSVQLLSFAQVM